MGRRAVILALCVVVLAIAAWQLLRSLDETPPSRSEPAVVASPSQAPANQAMRTPVAPPVTAFATVRGVVRDEAGKPIANARVCSSLERCTSTAASGAYELADLPTTTSKLRAAAARFQPRLVWLTDLTSGDVRTVDLVLESGGVLVHGRVLDLRGRAIVGAIITEAVTEGVGATSRADGTFETWVAAGSAQLFAHAAGYACSVQRVIPPAQIDFALVPESSIAGVVVDGNDAPVAGVQVATVDAADTDRPHRSVTANDGTFRVVGLRPGSYELRAQSYGLAGRRWAVVGVGEHLTQVTIRVSEAFQVGVQVTRSDGARCVESSASLSEPNALRGGHVGMSRRQPGGSVIDAVPAGVYEVAIACDQIVTTRTLDVKDDVDVIYTVEAGPPTGTLRVTVDAPGRVPGEDEGLFLTYGYEGQGKRSAPVPGNRIVVATVPPGVYSMHLSSMSIDGTEELVTVRAGQTTEKVMRIAPPTNGRLRVTTVDAEGRTLTDVALAITSPQTERTARTHADGSVTLYLPAGNYEVSRPGVSVLAHVTSGASRDVRLVVPPTAIVRGVVVDTANRLIPNALVARINPQAYSDQPRVDLRSADANGAFQFPMMSDAPITLVATRIGGGESAAVQTDGKSPVKLVVGGGATLSGTVAASDGTRLPRFAITLSNVTRNVHVGERDFADGAFTWSSLDAGEYVVTALSDRLVVRGNVTIATDARSATIALTLPKVFTLAGRVVDAVSHEPIPNAWVTIEREVDSTRTGGSVGREQSARRTDAEGRFSFNDVIAASYQLVTIAGANHSTTSQLVNVSDANVDLVEIVVARVHK